MRLAGRGKLPQTPLPFHQPGAAYPRSNSTLVLLANQDWNVWEMTRRIQREMLRQNWPDPRL